MLPLVEFFCSVQNKICFILSGGVAGCLHCCRLGLACLHFAEHLRIDTPRIFSSSRYPSNFRASIYNGSAIDAILMEGVRHLHGTCFCPIFLCIGQITSSGQSSDC